MVMGAALLMPWGMDREGMSRGAATSRGMAMEEMEDMRVLEIRQPMAVGKASMEHQVMDKYGLSAYQCSTPSKKTYRSHVYDTIFMAFLVTAFLLSLDTLCGGMVGTV